MRPTKEAYLPRTVDRAMRALPIFLLMTLAALMPRDARPAIPENTARPPSPPATASPAPAVSQLDAHADLAALSPAAQQRIDELDREARAHRELLGLRINFLTAAILFLQVGTFVAQIILLQRTLRSSEATARRQLKAYVFVRSHKLDGVASNEPLNARIVLRNFGQTPAYKLTVAARGAIGKNWNDAQAAPLHDATTIGNLGPGGEYRLTVTYRPGLSAIEVGHLLDGTHALFIYGRARYQDAFGKQRYVNFRVMTGTRFGADIKELVSCPEGNDSDEAEPVEQA